jgi:hypothetical protein
MTNEPITKDSTDAELRDAYNRGVRISTLMRLTGKSYQDIQGRLQRIGARMRTGDKR